MRRSTVLQQVCRRSQSELKSPLTCWCLCPRWHSEWPLKQNTFTSADAVTLTVILTCRKYVFPFKWSHAIITYPGPIKWLQTRRFLPWVQGWRAAPPSFYHKAAGRDPTWWHIPAIAWAWQRKDHLNDVRYKQYNTHFRKCILENRKLYHITYSKQSLFA